MKIDSRHIGCTKNSKISWQSIFAPLHSVLRCKKRGKVKLHKMDAGVIVKEVMMKHLILERQFITV